MENAALYACRLDGCGRVLACNQRLAAAAGQDAGSLSGRPFAGAFARPEERSALEHALLLDGDRQSLPGSILESTIVPPGGAPVHHVRWFTAPFDCDGGRPGLLVLGWDDTAQVQMEHFLLRLARVVDLTQEPVVIANGRGVAEYVNPAFTTCAGYLPGEIVGRSLSGIVAVPEDSALIRTVVETFHRGEPWDGTLRMRRKDGTVLVLNTRIHPVRDASKKTTHYIAIAHDLSRQQTLERQVEELQRLESLGTLANGLAHRFNNILAAISGQTELLLMSTTDEVTRKRADRILEAAGKGKEVVEQLTVFGRRNDPRPHAADLVPVVRNAVNFIRAAQPRAVAVEADLPAASPLVLANTSEIHQVLLNLLTNALQAIGENPGHICVRLRTDLRTVGDPPTLRPCVVIEVEDDGPGVPPEIQHRIFEPFFTTRSLADSSGMGLATSHGIVTRHSGKIDCHNGPGGGAVFTMVLPVITATSAAGAQPVTPQPQGSGRILLIDAAGFALETGKRQLQELHYEVVALANFDAALEAVRDPTVEIGLVLTCYKLSHRSGLDFARQVRHLRPALPIILCANLDDPVDLHEAREAGVNEILRKPIPLHQLSGVIGELTAD